MEGFSRSARGGQQQQAGDFVLFADSFLGLAAGSSTPPTRVHTARVYTDTRSLESQGYLAGTAYRAPGTRLQSKSKRNRGMADQRSRHPRCRLLVLSMRSFTTGFLSGGWPTSIPEQTF